MALNTSKGNMYEFITHTWNTIKGECFHDCTYCYMKRWGKLNPVRFDVKELRTDLGTGNFIFVGSSCDMFAEDIPSEWILRTLLKCSDYHNSYLYQTKNPARIIPFRDAMPIFSNHCVTIETNRNYPEIMRNCPSPRQRVNDLITLNEATTSTCYVTIEPLMDFDLEEFLNMLELCEPKQVNIGADSGKNNLPEPTKDKVISLIEGLEKFTTIHNKSNLRRLLEAVA